MAWTAKLEEHLGDPAFSLFDDDGERSAVGLTAGDAAAICTAMNSHAELLGACQRLVLVAAEYRASLSPGLPETETERAARAAIANATGGSNA